MYSVESIIDYVLALFVLYIKKEIEKKRMFEALEVEEKEE
jgi:hypothetical protein